MGRPSANLDSFSGSSGHPQAQLQPEPSSQLQESHHHLQQPLQFSHQNLHSNTLDHSMQEAHFGHHQMPQTNMGYASYAAHDHPALNPHVPVNYPPHATAPPLPSVVAPPACQVPVQHYSGVPAAIPLPLQPWTTGLFDCMDDPFNALATVCFPCLTFGQVAEIVDNGSTSCGKAGLIYVLVAAWIGCPCVYSCTYRTKMRTRFGLAESPAPDWLTHFLCEYCALCQEYRELQNRGLDPSIGWQGNLQRMQAMQQHHIAMMPPTNQTMRG